MPNGEAPDCKSGKKVGSTPTLASKTKYVQVAKLAERARLKIWCSKERVGSSPTLDTKNRREVGGIPYHVADAIQGFPISPQ